MISPINAPRSHRRSVRRFGFRAVLVALAAGSLAGCREEEDIQVYEIPKIPDRGVRSASPGDPGRLLGALLPAGDRTWFFKVSGPKAFISDHVDAVRRFIESVRLEAGEPKFDVPPGWKEQEGGPMRFKTLVIDSTTKPRIELAVSQLPGNQDVASNIQRWRGQLKMPTVSDDEALKDVKDLSTAAGPAKWVDLEGTYSADTMPPFAGGAMAGGPRGIPASGELPPDHPPLPKINGGAAPVLARTAPTGSPVKYEAPAEWTPVAPPQFTIAAFEAADGDKSLRITVSNAQGDLLSNVNRWRGQIGVPPIDAAGLETAVTKMKIGDRPGDYIELLGPAGERQTAIFVGMVPAAEGTWFVKLMGDASLAERERTNFSKFLATFKFER